MATDRATSRAWATGQGVKLYEVPAHRKAEKLMDAYLKAVEIAADTKGLLFRRVNRRESSPITCMIQSQAFQTVKNFNRNSELGGGRARMFLPAGPALTCFFIGCLPS